MKYIVDRIEDKYAVLEREDKQFENILLEKLPKGLREGDVIIHKDGKFEIELNETEKLKKEIEDLTEDMWE